MLAETVASEEWHEASATLLGRTSGSSAAGGSRYFSLAESEFEDAASELEPGACTVLLSFICLSALLRHG